MTGLTRVGLLLVVALSCVCVGTADTTLVPGTAVTGRVESGASQYYVVELTTGNTKPLTITTTPIGDGDPDVYVSLDIEHPTSGNAKWVLDRFGQDSVTISPEDQVGKTKVYITVFGYFLADFTIVASFGDVVALVDGRPQAGSLTLATEALYDFEVGGRTNVTITATALSGYVELYVGNQRHPDPTQPSTFQWSSIYAASGRVAVTISDKTTLWPLDNKFRIVVKAASDATFSITAKSEESQVSLRDGVSEPGSAGPGQLRYYQYNILNTGCKLTVTVTPVAGDPDLCISRTVPRPDPAQQQCDDQAASTGRDEISFDPATPGPYYISVKAYAGAGEATWTILAKAQCEGGGSDFYTYLQDGFPQSGTVAHGGTAYYRYHVGSTADITITLTNNAGDPDLWVSKNGTVPPGPNNFQWYSVNYGSDTVFIPQTDSKLCTNCDLFIAVVGDVESSYTIRAASSTGYITLQNGRPVTAHAARETYVYFKFDVMMAYSTLTFTVTDFAMGDPDLFISTSSKGITRPVLGNATWTARRSFDDSISIPPTDSNFCYFCTYYIGVYAYRETEFSIIAHFDDPVLLTNGRPQDGVVATGEMKEYDFYILSGSKHATFTLTVWSGSASLLIGNSKYPQADDPSTYQRISAYYSTVHQIIYKDDDTDGCSAWAGFVCRYYVGVLGQRNATFTLMASTDDATIMLQSGVPVRETVSTGGWKYFQIQVTDEHTDLSISLQGISGDPDMYIKRGDDRPSDEEGHYDYKSERWGDDTIDIFGAAPGIWYIGVHAARSNSSFSIVALLTDQDSDDKDVLYWLTEGFPMTTTVATKHWAYFQLEIDTDVPVLGIAVTASFGDPDLFVNYCTDVENWCDANFPNSTDPRKSQWASTIWGSDLLRINGARAGTYIIGVYAYETTSFTISVTAGASTLLTAGVAVRGELANSGETNYYYFTNTDSATKTITVSLTTIDGDPDLYISTVSEKPGPGDSMWNATNWEDDSITITHPCPVGTYYVAVRAFIPSTYTIMVQFDEEVALTPGVPQQGFVRSEAYKFYTVRVGTKTDVTINLAVAYGGPRLHVRTAKLDGSDFKLPEIDNAQWSSGWGIYSLTIAQNDTQACGDCYYLIGVHGGFFYHENSYTITVTLGTGSTELLNGIPITSTLPTNAYGHYIFRVSPEKAGWDLDVTVTTVTGDPDLYISYPEFEEFPVDGCQRSQPATCWGSLSPSDDSIFVQSVKTGVYRISVHSWFTPSTYVVTAFLSDPKSNDTSILLLDGVPQNGWLDGGEWYYYYFMLRGVHRSMTIALARKYGDPDMFVKHSVDGWDWPDETHYDWSSASYGQEVLRIDNPPEGIYVIGVLAYEEPTAFTIVASTGSNIRTLLDGQVQSGSLAAGTYDYYQFPVIYSWGAGLTVTVTSIVGDPDLFISHEVERPNSTTPHTYKATHYLEDSITIPEPEFGPWYIGVYAWSSSIYTIVASMSDEIVLSDGLPQAGYVASQVSQLYRLELRRQHADVTITLQPLAAKSAYVYVKVGSHPNRKEGDFDAASMERDSLQRISLPAPSPDRCEAYGVCIYYIEVFGQSSDGCSYTLTATSNTRSRVLQAGSMAWDNVAEDDYTYFTLQVDSPHANVIISVTALSGDPDLYVNTAEFPDFPDWLSYEYASGVPGTDALVVKFTGEEREGRKFTGVWRIAVYGWTDASFSILAQIRDHDRDPGTVDWVDLVNGLPQIGYVESEQSGGDNIEARMYYRFISSSNPEDLTFTLTPRYGDPDLFIRNDGGGMGPLVDEENAQYYSTGQAGESIVIPAAEFCEDCIYQILVHGYDESMYSITASTEAAIITLEHGIPFRGSLRQGGKAFFEINVDTQEELIISIQAVNGDPDLYISDDPNNKRPDKDHHTWESIAWGSDMFTVPQAKLGKYWMGVFAFSDNVQYIIRATIGAVTIVNAQPVDDFLMNEGAKRVYKFDVSGTMLRHLQNITFSLGINDNGGASMFISNRADLKRPNATHYDWSSRDVADATLRNFIYIRDDDPRNVRACYNGWCTYYIVVQADTSRVQYTLTASYGDIGQLLLNGAPVTATQPAKSYKYYEAVVLSATYDINIACTVFSGDVQVFVSLSNDRPHSGDFNWTSADPGALMQTIVIPTNAPGFRSGRYYISVWSKTEAKYSLVVTTQHTMLRPGVPQSGIIRAPWQGSFFFLSMQEATDITLSLNKLDFWNNPTYSIYVSNSDDNTQPGPGKYTWTRNVTDNQFFVIPQTDPKFKAPGTYYIGVYSDVYSRFSMKATLGDAMETLFFNLVQSNFVRVGAVKYYEIFVDSGRNFHLFLEPCQGDVDLFMSQNEFRPGPNTSYDWSSSKRDDIDDIKIDSDKIQRATFYIGVFGAQAESTTSKVAKYELYATNEADDQLKPVVHSPAIVAKPSGAHSVQLSFEAAAPPAGVAAQDLTYSVYRQEAGFGVVMYSYCGLRLSSFVANITKNTGGTITLNVPNLAAGTRYSFNVQVSTPKGHKALYKYVVGESSDDGKSGGGGPSWGTILGIAIPFFLLIAAVIAGLWWKNRKLTKELEIEMHDVPHAAVRKAVRGPRGGDDDDEKAPRGSNAKTYTKLLTDDDEDTSYAPPSQDPAQEL